MTVPFLPLTGVRVLDLSRHLPGPLLTRILADLGAEVIKVEPPEGDPVRYTPPRWGEHGAAFAGLNHGKRSLGLDLKKPEAVRLVLALLPRTDVVVETYRPGVLDRLGLGWERLAAVNPALVLCSVSGYGQRGPLRERAGHDIGYLARAGVLGLWGPPGGTPPTPGVQIADVGGGALSGALGVLAALLERQTTGRGRHLDVAMARAAALYLALEAPRRLAGQPEGRGDGLLTGGLPCYRVYAAKDGRHMALGALEAKFFAAFCGRAGVPQLASDGYSRGERGAEVVRELEALFASKTQAEWVALLDGCDCCCEPVRTPEEALADPELGIATREVGGLRVVATDVGAHGATGPSEVSHLGRDGSALCRELGVEPALIEAARAAGGLIEGL